MGCNNIIFDKTQDLKQHSVIVKQSSVYQCTERKKKTTEMNYKN